MSKFIEFAQLQWPMFLALVVIIVLLFLDPLRRRATGISTASHNDALRLLNDDSSVVIDVSDEAEFKTGHIEGAINSPASRLGNDLDRLSKYKNQPVLLTCKTGQKSSKAAGQLKKAGFEQIHLLQGGMAAWVRENLPVTRNA